jgi:hypothetical protein
MINRDCRIVFEVFIDTVRSTPLAAISPVEEQQTEYKISPHLAAIEKQMRKAQRRIHYNLC